MRLQRGARWSHMLVERDVNIERGRAVDRAYWYLPKTESLSPTASSLFVISYLDQHTQQFIDDSFATSESLCLQFWYAMSSAILSIFLSKTNINGILGRGGMFLFSSDHIRDFLQLPTEWNPREHTLLDLGSGDGGVTEQFADLFHTVHVTEMSHIMQWRLRQRGFQVIDSHDWPHQSHKYSLISALNLLDRHFHPKQLLRDLHKKSSESQCDVLLSLVLPIKPYVEFHPNSTSSKPDHYLSISGRMLEEQVNSLIEGEFRESGFQVIKWTKLPYLCEGDLHKPYYTLDDVLFLLHPFGDVAVNTVNQTSNQSTHIDL